MLGAGVLVAGVGMDMEVASYLFEICLLDAASMATSMATAMATAKMAAMAAAKNFRVRLLNHLDIEHTHHSAPGSREW